MVEPRPQLAVPTGRYSGVKEQPLRNWDRNKARMESIYQLPMRDFRQTAAQFGVPSSIADITTTEKGIPKMECTTTTKSDFCAPSIDRYINVQGVCPERDYPSSSGLEYCPGRESEVKRTPPLPASVPVMPRTRSTCPASLESLLPKDGPIPQLKYPPTVPQFSPTRNDASAPSSYPRRIEAPSVKEAEQPNYYKPNVEYLSARKEFKWPVPTEQLYSHRVQDLAIPDIKSVESTEDPLENEKNIEDYKSKIHEQDESQTIKEQTLEYPVIDDEYAEKRKLHDAMLERARREYEQNIGVPGSTVPLVKAGTDPPNAMAHYNVPDYTEGSTAGGMIRSKFGAPNWTMKMPITDPSYPRPENIIPQPEAGLTKAGYSQSHSEEKGISGIAHTPPVRYPDQVYNTVKYTEPDRVESPIHTVADRYIPPIRGAQENIIPDPSQEIIQTYGDRMELTQQLGEPSIEKTSEKPTVESQSMKGLRRIQTSNQVYGSWIDDPYLKDNDWWFKARPKNPRTKTYLSKYKEENGWQ